MKQLHRCCAAISAVAMLMLLAAVPAPADEAVDGWVALFNGNDLAGWVPKITGYPAGENFGDTFRVHENLLTVAYDQYDNFAGRFGHLFYQTPFSHYRLRIEYRFTGTQAADGPEWAFRNSGVMLHAQSPASMGLNQDFPISIENQFLGGRDDGTERSTGNLCTPGTNIVWQGVFTTAHCVDSSSLTQAGDRWVMVEILVLGQQRMVHLINGEAVLEYSMPSLGGGAVSGHDPALVIEGQPLGEGYIALQSESHPVQFRRVEIRNLKGCMDETSEHYRNWYVEADPAACR